MPTARSGWYSVRGHLRRALSARGSPCGAPTVQRGWCSVLGHPCGADALALHSSGCLAALQPRKVVGTLFLATFGAPTRTSGINAPCVSYSPAWRARSTERPVARDMSEKSGKVVQRILLPARRMRSNELTVTSVGPLRTCSTRVFICTCIMF